jgi:hypothetical protein
MISAYCSQFFWGASRKLVGSKGKDQDSTYITGFTDAADLEGVCFMGLDGERTWA